MNHMEEGKRESMRERKAKAQERERKKKAGE